MVKILVWVAVVGWGGGWAGMVRKFMRSVWLMVGSLKLRALEKAYDGLLFTRYWDFVLCGLADCGFML